MRKYLSYVIIALVSFICINVVNAENINSIKMDVYVDGSKRRMKVSARYSRENDINIGHEWQYSMLLNGKIANGDYIIAVGDTLDFYARFLEDDDDPDIGEAATSYIVTDDDLVNGFKVTMNLYVTENGGRYRGKSAEFIVTYTFTPK